MAKKENQHRELLYTVYIKERGSERITEYTINGWRLKDVIVNYCNKCVNEGNTEAIISLKDTDCKGMVKNPKFHIVHTKYGMYGVMLDDVKINADIRNPLLLSLRAKRELLGLSVERAAELVACPSYKSKEQGRPMKSAEYDKFMNIFSEYEKSGDFEKISKTSKQRNENTYCKIENKLTATIGKEIAYVIRTNKLSKEDYEEILSALAEQRVGKNER